jgi:hypothetical protein
MIKLARYLARYLLALAAVIASLEAVSREAEPPKPDCPVVAPCTGPQLVALPPDGPDSPTDTMPPATAQMWQYPAPRLHSPVSQLIDFPFSFAPLSLASPTGHATSIHSNER